MPTYEYRCENGHEFEQFQKMSDEPLRECPECGGAAERRISSGAGLLFKGSGFYITDYKNAGDPKRKKAESSSGGGSDGASGGGSESAPGSGSESAPGKRTGSGSDAAGGTSDKGGGGKDQG